MSFNGSGTYVPPTGVPVVTGTVIQSSVFNGVITDIGNTFNNTLPRDGQASMTGQLKLSDGTATQPAFAFNSESSSGLFRPSTGVVALTVSGVEALRSVAGRLLLGTVTDDGTTRLQVSGSATVSANASVAGTLTVLTANVTGNATVSGTSTHTGAATFGSTVGVTGATTIGSLSVAGTSAHTGNATFGGTLGVTGATTLSGATNVNNNLGVTGTLTASGGVSGNLTGNVTGNVTGTITGHSTLDLPLTGGTLSGSLGVNVSPSANYAVDVSGTIRSTGGEATSGYGIRILNATGSGGGAINAISGVPGMRISSDAGNMFLAAGGSDRLTVNNGGGVNIPYPTTTAQVNGLILEGSGSSTGHISPMLVFSSSNINSAIWSSRYSSYGGDLILGTQPVAGGLPVERMRIDQSGNVGLGGSPTGTGRLQVVKASANTTIVSWTDSANSTGRLSILPSGVGIGSDGFLAFSTNQAGTDTFNERMRIDTSGNLVLGTTSTIASAKLCVSTTSSSVAEIDSSNANGGYMGFSNSGTAYGYIGAGATLTTGGAVGNFTVRYANNLVFDHTGVTAASFDGTQNFVMSNSGGGLGANNINTMLAPTPGQVGTTFTKVAAFGTTGTTSASYAGQWRWYHAEGFSSSVYDAGWKLKLRTWDNGLNVEHDIVTFTGGTNGAFDVTAGSGRLTIGGAITRAEVGGAAPAASMAYSVAHGGPRKPDIVRGVLRCLTANVGYSAGDEVDITNYVPSGSTGGAVWASATNVGYSSNGPSNGYVVNKGATGYSLITYSSWAVVFYCIWL